MFVIGGEQLLQRLHILHFRIARVLSLKLFLMRFCQFGKLQTSIIQKMNNKIFLIFNMLFLDKPEKVIKKSTIIQKKGIQSP